VASSTKKKKDADAPAEEPASSLIPGLEEPASAATKSYTVLARRYRSRTFDEVVGQESISRTLQNAISNGRTAHAYLFCGTRGVGKTSMARVFARALNASSDLQQAEAVGASILRGEDLDVIEIDGASNRGVDDARDLISKAGIAPAALQIKALAMAVGLVFLIEGVLMTVLALTHRHAAGWGWGLANGVVTLVLGLLILTMSPAGLLSVLGLLVGISFLFSGFDLLGFSARLHGPAPLLPNP
jgi:hypothetical protein